MKIKEYVILTPDEFSNLFGSLTPFKPLKDIVVIGLKIESDDDVNTIYLQYDIVTYNEKSINVHNCILLQSKELNINYDNIIEDFLMNIRDTNIVNYCSDNKLQLAYFNYTI